MRTYGCQMNAHDSERIAGLLDEAGYAPVTDSAQPDVVVFSTCAVRENADNKLDGNLGHLKPRSRTARPACHPSTASSSFADPLTALGTRCSVGRERLVVHSTISSMGDDDVDRPEPPSAKAVTAMLREARSLSRRADKLSGTAAAVDDPTTQQLAAEACTSMEQLVHHLMVLERQLQRGEKSASRRL